jgi:hypothetical protein
VTAQAASRTWRFTNPYANTSLERQQVRIDSPRRTFRVAINYYTTWGQSWRPHGGGNLYHGDIEALVPSAAGGAVKNVRANAGRKRDLKDAKET